MSVHLKNINIKNLGPLKSFSFEFGNVNLIFGSNETGKTYLVEFILNSIFRHAANWSIRDSGVEGSIIVSGLRNEPTPFSPSNAKKIEDYWSESEQGLPLNMSRLLIVKGGDLDLAENVPGGISKGFLKTALSNQDLLDEIWNRIPATVQKSSLVEMQIIGNNQGEIKDFNNAKNVLANLEILLGLIEKQYSRGPASLLEIDSSVIKKELQIQSQSKRHKAYLISREIKSLTEDKTRLSEEILSNLRDNIRDLNTAQQDLADMNDKIEASENSSDNYSWLETAISIWETSSLENKGKPTPLPAYIGGGLLGAGLVTLLLEQFYQIGNLFLYGLAGAISGSVVIAYYIYKIIRWSNSIDESSERDNLLISFQEKFGFSPRGVVDLRDQKNKLQEIFSLNKSQRNLRDQKKIEINNYELKIADLFLDINNHPVTKENWEITYQELRSKAIEISEQIQNSKLVLNSLDVPEDDYSAEPGDQEFDPILIEKLEEDLKRNDKDLADYYKELESLKIRACDQTGDDPTTPWSDVLYNLRTKLEIQQESMKIRIANLIAKIGLTEILTKIQEEEDQKIRSDINAPEISSLLSDLTGKYQSLDFIDDQIFAATQYSQYPIEDISTGARDQIQIALRLGITSHLTGGMPLFLILDDAFQHSDWKRREFLVKSMIDLGKQGWQITYLSMDDHIRDLFNKYAKPVFKDQYRYTELPG